MAIRNVVDLHQEVIRKRSKEVKNFEDNLEILLDDMWETMYKNNGMGLAAVQVGVLKRVVVMEVNNMRLELINPKIVKTKGKDIEEEGCLSCNGIKGFVERPMEVTVVAQDRYGYNFSVTGEKWLARCICHELDHLDGVLFVDKTVEVKKG